MLSAEDIIIQKLLTSQEPSIRLRTRIEILGEPPESKACIKLQHEVKLSGRVALLLARRKSDGKLRVHPYSKWYGAHWVLSLLADLRYPPGDSSLVPLREQVYDWLFSEQHLEYMKGYEAQPIFEIRGLTRAHASMEGNALYYLNALGLADHRTQELADRLLEWQWPDGGWNCDRNPSAHTSSFTESLLPLRGLAFHLKSTHKSSYKEAVRKAAEFFLERSLYKRKRDGRVISSNFTKLHYPCYWHYDILFGLKVMNEAGFLEDERCGDAIALLRSKRLDQDGGFSAEHAYYRKTGTSGSSPVDWGGVSREKMNEFVTCDSLSVLVSLPPS